MVERTPAEIVALVFVALAVIVVLARLMGRLAVRVGQPAVVGEIIAGIMLGPSLLGALPGDLDTLLFPPDIRPFLNVLAQLGLVLFMFLVGLEVDLTFIRGRERVALSVSMASIVLPFGLGILLALQLHPRHDQVGGAAVEFLPFALFLGVAMSITAFPVLARILSESSMHRVPAGVLALACAAVDDVFAWALLAIVVAVTAGGSAAGVGTILVLAVVFGLVMFLLVRPLLRRLVGRFERHGRLTPDMLAVVLVGVLISAFVTEEIGIHVIFGAFVFGVVMPRQGAGALNHAVIDGIEKVAVLLLLPVFFVVTGLGVDIGGIDGTGLLELLGILLVAIVGKFVGASAAARAQGVPRRQALSIGVLMNARGLTELVILNIGVTLGVLDSQMFTLMVIMAVVTTVMTVPLLRLVYPPRAVARDIEAAERAALGIEDAYTVVVVVDDPVRDAHLVGLGCDLAGRERPAQVVITQVLAAPSRPEVASGLGADLTTMTEAAGVLRRLSSTATDRGFPASVSARFADDAWGTVAAQARDADVLLVPSAWAATVRPADPRAATLVLAYGRDDAGLDGVAVAVSGDDDSPAALRLAAQVALARGADLALATGSGWRSGRRLEVLGGLLSRAGLATSKDEGGAVAVRVVPLGAAPASHAGTGPLVLAVAAGTRDADRDLEETIAEIDAGAPAPAPEPG